VQQIDAVIIVIILPDSNILKIQQQFLEPNFRILKDMLSWKPNISSDNFNKNLQKNHSFIESFLQDCLEGLDQTGFQIGGQNLA
jgi:hypothetical protein